MSEHSNRRMKLRGLVAITLEALLLSDILIVFNLIFVSYYVYDLDAVVYLVSLVTLIEGGLGLTIGGLSVIAAGPSLSKVSEKMFHRAPYSIERAKRAEGTARLLVFFSTVLLVIGFLI